MQDQDQNLSTESTFELADELALFNQYEDASPGQRCLNLVIDWVFMRFTLTYAITPLVVHSMIDLFPDFTLDVLVERRLGGMFLLNFIIWTINYLIYYTICEKLFRGYTVGKFITGTRAIREDGAELTFGNTLVRTLSRLIPFEVIGIFRNGIPWHDSLSKTRVIKTR